MQIETTMKYQVTPIGMAIIKIARIGEDVEKKEPLYTIDGNVNWCSHCEKQHGGSSKNYSTTTICLYNSTSRFASKEVKTLT